QYLDGVCRSLLLESLIGSRRRLLVQLQLLQLRLQLDVRRLNPCSWVGARRLDLGVLPLKRQERPLGIGEPLQEVGTRRFDISLEYRRGSRSVLLLVKLRRLLRHCVRDCRRSIGTGLRDGDGVE